MLGEELKIIVPSSYHLVSKIFANGYLILSRMVLKCGFVGGSYLATLPECTSQFSFLVTLGPVQWFVLCTVSL